MKFMKLKRFGKSIADFGSKNSHIIAGSAAIVGVVATAVCAYKARPKMDRIMKEKQEKMDELDESIEIPEEEYKRVKREIVWETVKEATPVMGPTVLVGSATVGAIIFSLVSSNKKISDASAIAAGYSMAYRELYDKTKEVVGEEKAEEIKKEIHQDHVDQISEYGTISIDAAGFYETGLGNDPWFDSFSGMLFKCSESAIKDAVLRCKERLIDGEPYFVMNELYSELHLPQPTAGKKYGFKIDSLTNQRDLMKPNLGNAVRWGEGSVAVLDWWEDPYVVTDRLGG